MANPATSLAETVSDTFHRLIGQMFDALELAGMSHAEAAGCLGPILLRHCVTLAREAGIPATMLRRTLDDFIEDDGKLTAQSKRQGVT